MIYLIKCIFVYSEPINFSHIYYFQDKLCGYVRDNLKEYIATRFENEEIQGIIDALSKQV